jgi:hypothetical protein
VVLIVIALMRFNFDRAVPPRQVSQIPAMIMTGSSFRWILKGRLTLQSRFHS